MLNHVMPANLTARDMRRKLSSQIGLLVLAVAGIGAVLLVLVLIGTVIYKGAPAINWRFLSQPPTEGMTAGGIWPMLRGSILLMLGSVLITLPIGILGGICLAEYAGQSRFTGLMRACVTTLAGTPSIIYGLFGLAIFVIMFHFGISLLSGWLTLSMLALPNIVLTTEQAITQVPPILTNGGLALGLSRWQTMWRIVLPNALPGILTGIVLSTGRAAGEAPPILLTAGIFYSSGKLKLNWETIKQPVANLPYHLSEGYRQGGVIPERTIWGTCLTLMLFVVFINLAAMVVRSHVRRKQHR